jgi:hypothetical protein
MLPKPIAGDWDGGGVDTIGITSRSITGGLVFNLRNDNSTGSADIVVTFGTFSSEVGIVGNWDEQ